MSNEADVNIVIIGSSFAGSSTGKRLERIFEGKLDVKITIIELQQEFFVSTTTPRAVVHAHEYGKKAFIKLDKIFSAGSRHSMVYGKVVNVDLKAVKLESGERIKFDYLIIATGTSYGVPFKIQLPTRSETEKILDHYSNCIKEAANINIIGGGIVACELAGEIISFYQSKSVTIICSQSTLLASNSAAEPSTKSRVQSKLKNMGVKFIFNERILLDREQNNNIVWVSDHYIKTESGKEIHSNLTFLCLGIGSPNTHMLHSEILNKKKEVKVKSTLQVDCAGYEHVFALGDVAATGSSKCILPIYERIYPMNTYLLTS